MHPTSVVLRFRLPAGFTLKSVTGSGGPWWISDDDVAIQPNGSISLLTQDTLSADLHDPELLGRAAPHQP